MSDQEKNNLIERLTQTHLSTQNTLKGVDLEIRVYPDTDWRIRDILGHITTWDREATKSLRAFLRGDEYCIPDLDEDETDFNQQAVLEQRKLTTKQIIAEWEQAHDDSKDALRAIPIDRFPGDLLYPWGDERGNIAQLVEFMIEHEVDHQNEIIKAIKASAEN